MKLIILGMGCPRCAKLAANSTEAAKSLGLEFELEEITDKEVIANEYGGPALPALVVDGAILSAGQVLEVEAVKALLSDPASSAKALEREMAKENASNQRRRIVAIVALVVLVALAIYAALSDVTPVISEGSCSEGSCPAGATSCGETVTVEEAPSTSATSKTSSSSAATTSPSATATTAR